MKIEFGKSIKNFAIFVAILVVMMQGALALTPADPPEPSYITHSSEVITLDGDLGEWLTNDEFASLSHNNPSYPPKTLSLRYDCGTDTLYVMVLATPGTFINPNPAVLGEHWVKVNGGGALVDETSSDFAYISDSAGTIGWEASVRDLPPASYTSLKVHTIEDINGESTEETFSVNIPLLIKCGDNYIPEFPSIVLPVAAILGLMFIFGRKSDL